MGSYHRTATPRSTGARPARPAVLDALSAVDGQGYFGSVDGDSAAAMRYTECPLADGDRARSRDRRRHVDFVPNYDGSQREPSVLRPVSRNLLVNGSSGIAVGNGTNMPPHNLGEVVDGSSR